MNTFRNSLLLPIAAACWLFSPLSAQEPLLSPAGNDTSGGRLGNSLSLEWGRGRHVQIRAWTAGNPRGLSGRGGASERDLLDVLGFSLWSDEAIQVTLGVELTPRGTLDQVRHLSVRETGSGAVASATATYRPASSDLLQFLGVPLGEEGGTGEELGGGIPAGGNLAVIPEPSTYALMVSLAAVAAAALARGLRRSVC